MNISPVRLTAPSNSVSQGECTTLDRAPVTQDSGEAGASPRQVAALTSDVLDYLCGHESLNRSTAAVLSARFPYVSPSGRLLRCHNPDPKVELSTAVVDGGYADNTGAQELLNLWYGLEPLVAAHNACRCMPVIVPIFVELDNHYTTAGGAGPLARTPEFLVPPETKSRTGSLDSRGVEQLAQAEFSLDLPGVPGGTCHLSAPPQGQSANRPANSAVPTPRDRYIRIAPGESPGVQAPLGWTLSRIAMNDLDNQRATALADAPARELQLILAGASVPCQDQPARQATSPSTAPGPPAQR
jgi:hypothetical protein